MDSLRVAMERYRGLVDDWEAFQDSLHRHLPSCLWTNQLRTDAEELEEILREEGLNPRPLPWCPGAFRIDECSGLGNRWWYLAGLCHSQEEASLLPPALLDVRPGMRVLDLCAAPGGKTARLALALGNRGTIVANDPQPGRMNMLRSNLKRLGILNVTTVLRDAGSFPRRAGGFDRILVDAPCSCEGTVRKHPGTVEGEARRPVRQQEAFLATAARLCRPGGRVVYSTCTFAPEENEAVVDAVLRRSEGRDLRLVPARIPGFPAAEGLVSWQGKRFDPSLSCCLRVWPHQADTGGFFVAVLEKDPSAREPWELPPVCTGIEVPELAGQIVERFGIVGELWPDHLFHKRSSKGAYLVAADHRPPLDPPPYASGLIFLRTMKPAKPSTAAVLQFGRRARRNLIELNEEELEPYFTRQTFPLEAKRLRDCEPDGVVIVRYRGHPLGTAFLPGRGGVIRSLYPKGWSLKSSS